MSGLKKGLMRLLLVLIAPGLLLCVEIVLRLSRDILAMARDSGVDCIVTACPLCQLNLDMRQGDIEAQFGGPSGLPVFYFTQLLSLALGLKPNELALSSLIVDPLPLLRRKGVLARAGTVAAAPVNALEIGL